MDSTNNPGITGVVASPPVPPSPPLVLPSAPSFDNPEFKTRLDHAWKTHEYINNYIRFADAKGIAIIATSTAVVGVLFNAHIQDSFTTITIKQWTLTSAFSLVAFCLLTIGIIVSFWTIKPRLPNKRIKGFIFWDCILGYKHEEFAKEYQSQSQIQILTEIAEHLHILSDVARRKYQLIWFSIYAALTGGILGGILLLLK